MDIAPTYPHSSPFRNQGYHRFTIRGAAVGAGAQMMGLGRVLVQPIDLESIGFIIIHVTITTITIITTVDEINPAAISR